MAAKAGTAARKTCGNRPKPSRLSKVTTAKAQTYGFDASIDFLLVGAGSTSSTQWGLLACEPAKVACRKRAPPASSPRLPIRPPAAAQDETAAAPSSKAKRPGKLPSSGSPARENMATSQTIDRK